MTTPLIQFTLVIAVQQRRREFNFRMRSKELYDGNTTDERGDRYYFQITKHNDQWKLSGTQLPAWIRDNEPAIVQALTEKETKDSAF